MSTSVNYYDSKKLFRRRPRSDLPSLKKIAKLKQNLKKKQRCHTIIIPDGDQD